MKVDEILQEEFDPGQFITQFEQMIKKLSVEQLRELGKMVQGAARGEKSPVTRKGPGAKFGQKTQQQASKTAHQRQGELF